MDCFQLMWCHGMKMLGSWIGGRPGTAVLRYFGTAVLRYCRTAVLPYCGTSVLPYCFAAVLHVLRGPLIRVRVKIAVELQI